MNPELANALAWVFLSFIGLTFVWLLVLGVKYLVNYIKPAPSPYLLREEAISLFEKQMAKAKAQATVVAE
jgi:hypothetical protein